MVKYEKCPPDGRYRAKMPCNARLAGTFRIYKTIRRKSDNAAWHRVNAPMLAFMPPLATTQGTPMSPPLPGPAALAPPVLPLLSGPTPLMELHRLPARMGMAARLFVKSDDAAWLGGGGNKLRKLAYLVADAQAQGADTLVTSGGLQSNHARLTAAVAAHCGMRCELVLRKLVPRSTPLYEHNGNVLLMQRFGAHLHVLEGTQDAAAYTHTLLADLRGAGRTPYVIPFGGSSALGALGYVRCAQEITTQLAEQGVQADTVTVACTAGSGGTQAGLVAGFAALGAPTRVQGMSVLFAQSPIEATVHALANETLALLGAPPVPASAVAVNDAFIGAGYGIPTEEGLAAIDLVAQTEGLLLDPVYTGKTFAGLLTLARRGAWQAGQTVVFVHTGGAPALYAYGDAFDNHRAEAP